MLRAQLCRCCGIAALILGLVELPGALSAGRPVGAPAAGDVVYGVGEEFTVQTDASLVQLAQTTPRENVAAVKQRLGAAHTSVECSNRIVLLLCLLILILTSHELQPVVLMWARTTACDTLRCIGQL
jgi:hypothetical protein